MIENSISLKDALCFVVDNRGKTVPTEETGMKLIATNCISNDNLYPSYTNPRYVSGEIYQNWFRAHPEPGDIILTNKGSKNGAICLVPDKVDFCIAQDMMALRADPIKIDPLYLFAALRSKQVQADIKNLNVDGVIPHFKKTDFKNLYIPLPTRSEQKHIGLLHYELCKKIELNRKTAATLEDMARALYRSWFVDFDPVHARSQGLPPAHMPPTTASLFPDSFGEDGLPEGWELGTISSLGDIVTGKTPSTKDAANFGDYCPFVKIPDMHGKMFVTNPSTYLSEKGVSTQKRQLLEAGSVSVSCIATLGLVTISPKQAQTNQQINSVVPSPEFSTEFVYWTCFEAAKEVLLGGSGGSVFGNVNKSTFAAIPVQLAEPEIRLAFTSVVSNLHDKILQIENENQTLATLRDTLLPRLMSGELRVGDAREETEEIR